MGRARDRASADLNGQEFILDADADTSISADTDAQIDIKIAGADDFQFTANTFTAQSGSTIAAQALTATTVTTSSTVDVQGNEIILDDDGDTSITADTDDRIDFKVGGSDAVHILSTGQVAIGSTTAPVSDAQLVLSGDGSTDSSPFLEFVNTSASNDETVGGFLSVIGTDSVAEITTRRESANDDAYIFFGTQATGGSLTERMRIDSNGFLRQRFTSDNSTTAEGLFINNMQNSTGNNASLIFSNDSGGRKKAAIAHIDTGSYGTGDLVFALDGADSGALHLTNDEKMRINNDGIVTMPLQPAVITHNNASNNQSFSSADTYEIVTFNIETIDKNADYSPNTFTAPVDGTYYANANVLRTATSSGSITYDLAVYVNSSLTLYARHHGDNSGSNTSTQNVTGLLDLDASDTVQVYARVSDTKGQRYQSQTSTYFHVFLLG